MAKDGTNRGGARIGAGKKKMPLVDKIVEGKLDSAEILPTPLELADIDIPPPKEYLTAPQKDGSKLYAELIYNETWQWLKAHGCSALIAPQLVENYAQVSARFIFCEEQLSKYGMIGRHPTTGEPMPSPFVRMSIGYLKQSNQLWVQIYQVVKENCAMGYDGANPQNDLMESLLQRVK